MDILNLSDKIYDWIDIWAKVTLKPKKLIAEFVSDNTEQISKGLLFFVGSQFVAFFAMFLISIFDFSFFYHNQFGGHIRKDGLTILGLTSLLFIGFCIINLILTVVNSIVTYVFYRSREISINAKQHTNILFYLSNFDFISLSCIVSFILADKLKWVIYSSLIISGLVKIYYLILGFLFLTRTYKLSGFRAVGPFIGFVISSFLFNFISGSVVYILVTVWVFGLD